MFGLFKSKKKDTVSREVAVLLAKKVLAAEAELENLAAHSEKLISENESLLKRVVSLDKSNYYFDLACNAYEMEAQSYRNINDSLIEDKKHLREVVEQLKQDLAASRKACEHMRKTRH